MVEGGWMVSLDLLKDVVIALLGAYAGMRMQRAAEKKQPKEASSDS